MISSRKLLSNSAPAFPWNFILFYYFFLKKKKKKKEKRKKGMRDLRVESTKDSREMKTRNSASY
jgi:hypothetical protein